MHLLSLVTLTRSLNPTVVEPTKIDKKKEKNNNTHCNWFSVSGAELGRADYGPIPRNCNWVGKEVTPLLVPEPQVWIRFTNRLFYHEYERITGLM